MAISFSYFLIGTPASGKSTFAEALALRLGNCVIVSTDAIRQEKNWEMTGHWEELNQEIIARTEAAIAKNETVVYDATNAKKEWRTSMLQQFKKIAPTTGWVGFHIQTPLKICLNRNQKRPASVPPNIIDQYHQWLTQYPPVREEGFGTVITVTPDNDLNQILTELEQWKKSNKNLINRYGGIDNLHKYSLKRNFERLMYLITLLLHYPYLGEWHRSYPQDLKKILGVSDDSQLLINDVIEEIAAVMAKKYNVNYADREAIEQDLQFLEEIELVNSPYSEEPIVLPAYTDSQYLLERNHCAPKDTFSRILYVIRYIAHHPFVNKEKILDELGPKVYSLDESNLRKDIEKVFNPYNIFPNMKAFRNGYFIGTSIFQANQLQQIYPILKDQLNSLQDPTSVNLYQDFESRLKKSQILVEDIHPVRTISLRSIVDMNSLQNAKIGGLYKTDALSYVEEAIKKGECLEVKRYQHAPTFTNDPIQQQNQNSAFLIYPLQIVFYDIAWYLGFEYDSFGEEVPRFSYERLERLTIVNRIQRPRSLEEQKKALNKLEKLTEASFSVFLGKSRAEQEQLLNNDLSVMITIEFHCNRNIFTFLVEGSKRFPKGMMKMSIPPNGRQEHHDEDIYCLNQSGDENFPYRFQLTLPKWVIKDNNSKDINLLKWLLSYGNNIKVVAPEPMVELMRQTANDISSLYENTNYGGS